MVMSTVRVLFCGSDGETGSAGKPAGTWNKRMVRRKKRPAHHPAGDQEADSCRPIFPYYSKPVIESAYSPVLASISVTSM